jgi:hypothetical protein
MEVTALNRQRVWSDCIIYNQVKTILPPSQNINKSWSIKVNVSGPNFEPNTSSFFFLTHFCLYFRRNEVYILFYFLFWQNYIIGDMGLLKRNTYQHTFRIYFYWLKFHIDTTKSRRMSCLVTPFRYAHKNINFFV